MPKAVSIRFDDDLFSALASKAKAENTPLSEFIRREIAKAIGFTEGLTIYGISQQVSQIRSDLLQIEKQSSERISLLAKAINAEIAKIKLSSPNTANLVERIAALEDDLQSLKYRMDIGEDEIILEQIDEQ